MNIDNLLVNMKESQFSRFVSGDGSISPTRDTGFRMPIIVRKPYHRSPRMITVDLDSDQYHNSEITRCGEIVEQTPAQETEWGKVPYGGRGFSALTGVDFVSVDRDAAEQRNLTYIRENITRQKAYENSVKGNISSLQ